MRPLLPGSSLLLTRVKLVRRLGRGKGYPYLQVLTSLSSACVGLSHSSAAPRDSMILKGAEIGADPAMLRGDGGGRAIASRLGRG